MKKNLLLGCIIGVSVIALALAAGPVIPALRARLHFQPAQTPADNHQVVSVDAGPHASAQAAPTLAPRPIFASHAPLPARLAPVPPEALPRLSGILIMGTARRAIFESGNTTQVYVVGDRIGAYRILDIEQVSVTVEGPQGTQTLRPDGDDGATQAPPAQSSPPSLLDQLHTQPPPVVAVPRPPSLTQMLSRLPKGH